MKRGPTAPGLTIVVDTREKKTPASAYSFDGLCPSVRRKLDVGDYAVAGHELAFACERKEIADLYSTLIGDRPRFERELERARAVDLFVLLIEGSLDEVRSYRCDYWRDRDGLPLTEEGVRSRQRTCVNTLWSLMIERRAQVIFGSRDRNVCRTIVVRLAERVWRAKHPPEKKVRGSGPSAERAEPA